MKYWEIFGRTEGKTKDGANLPDRSSVHFFAGAIAHSWADIGLLPWELLHLAYEVKDRYKHTEDATKDYNSFINTIGDTAATTAGHLLGTHKRSNLLLFAGALSLLFCTQNDDVG